MCGPDQSMRLRYKPFVVSTFNLIMSILLNVFLLGHMHTSIFITDFDYRCRLCLACKHCALRASFPKKTWKTQVPVATADVTHRPGAMTMDAGGAYGFVLLVGAELSSWWRHSQDYDESRWNDYFRLFPYVTSLYIYIYTKIYVYIYILMYAVYCFFTFYYLQLVLESWWLPKCLWEAQISGPLRPTALSRAALLETVGWARAAEQLLVLLSVVPLRWDIVEIACVCCRDLVVALRHIWVLMVSCVKIIFGENLR